jgi:hypothetical protein
MGDGRWTRCGGDVRVRDSVGALGLGLDPAGAAQDAVGMVLFRAHRLLEPLAVPVILAAPVIEERDATWDLRSSGRPATS